VITEPGVEVGLRERLRLESELPGRVDLSIFDELPLNVRRRVLREGDVVYSRDKEHVFELVKITDFEYPRYREVLDEYHDEVMEKVRRRAKS